MFFLPFLPNRLLGGKERVPIGAQIDWRGLSEKGVVQNTLNLEQLHRVIVDDARYQSSLASCKGYLVLERRDGDEELDWVLVFGVCGAGGG